MALVLMFEKGAIGGERAVRNKATKILCTSFLPKVQFTTGNYEVVLTEHWRGRHPLSFSVNLLLK